MQVLLTREEMTYDFGADKLVPARDQALLEWMFNQFLYGEVTGIQVGHWLYDAPDFEAAKFLGCHSIRVNARSTGDPTRKARDQARAVASRLAFELPAGGNASVVAVVEVEARPLVHAHASATSAAMP